MDERREQSTLFSPRRPAPPESVAPQPARRVAASPVTALSAFSAGIVAAGLLAAGFMGTGWRAAAAQPPAQGPAAAVPPGVAVPVPGTAAAPRPVPGQAPGPSSSAAPVPSHDERLRVREVEVVFEPPQLPPGRKSLSELRPEDLEVLDGGEARPVVRLEPVAAGGAGAWSLAVYLDLVLARPETVFKAAIAAAERAPQLVQLGAVDVVVADPRPRRLLAGSRDPAQIEAVLAGVAARARLAQTPRAQESQAGAGAARAVSPAVLRRQCDRLLTELDAHVPVGPHALLLAADPPWLSPAEMERLSHALAGEGTTAASAGQSASAAGATAAAGGATAPAERATAPAARVTAPAAGATALAAGATAPAAGAPASAAGESAPEVLAETSRMLAAYGWLTVALPLRSLPSRREPALDEEMARVLREPGGAGAPASAEVVSGIVALVQKMRGKEPINALDLRLLAPQVDPTDASLVAFVRPTAGTVVPYRELVRASLDRLGGLWHLWYQAAASPTGEARPLVLRVPARPQEVRAPRWVRTSVPSALAAARLRRLLAGDPLFGDWRLELRATPLVHGQVVIIGNMAGVPEGVVPGEPAEGPLRFSVAWKEGPDAFHVEHQLLGSQALALWNSQRAVRVIFLSPPTGTETLAVLIEDLASERWGGGPVQLRPAVRLD
jgi:hypothetical protein